MNSISYHQWPPSHTSGGQHVTRTQCGILAIDEATGYAVACVSERSQEANRELAEHRLRTLAMLRDTPDDVANLLVTLSSQAIASRKTCDALENLNAIATKRVTELERDVDILRSMVPM